MTDKPKTPWQAAFVESQNWNRIDLAEAEPRAWKAIAQAAIDAATQNTRCSCCRAVFSEPFQCADCVDLDEKQAEFLAKQVVELTAGRGQLRATVERVNALCSEFERTTWSAYAGDPRGMIEYVVLKLRKALEP